MDVAGYYFLFLISILAFFFIFSSFAWVSVRVLPPREERRRGVTAREDNVHLIIALTTRWERGETSLRRGGQTRDRANA